MSRLGLLGSNLRAVLGRVICAPLDARMTASIERLNSIAETMIADSRDLREGALDDIARDR